MRFIIFLKQRIQSLCYGTEVLLVESWHYTTFSRIQQRKLSYKEHLYGPTANCFNALEKI